MAQPDIPEQWAGCVLRGFVFNTSLYFSITSSEEFPVSLGRLSLSTPWVISLDGREINGSDCCPVQEFMESGEPDDAQAWLEWANSLAYLGYGIIQQARIGDSGAELEIGLECGYRIRSLAKANGQPNWKWTPAPAQFKR